MITFHSFNDKELKFFNDDATFNCVFYYNFVKHPRYSVNGYSHFMNSMDIVNVIEVYELSGRPREFSTFYSL